VIESNEQVIQAHLDDPPALSRRLLALPYWRFISCRPTRHGPHRAALK
jgi:hypothetical protein